MEKDPVLDPNMPFGKRLAFLRAAAELKQRDLAARMRVSQATVSRLESSDEAPTDILLLSKLARHLNTTIGELAPDFDAGRVGNGGGEGTESFFAFCPNPFCSRNKRALQNGLPTVYWHSYDSFPDEEFNEVNYCDRCGTELVKRCPECQKRLVKKFVRYCVRCGSKITERPTEEEWDRISKELSSEPAKEPEDTTTNEIPF